ncbi:MAG: glycosyltransferase [Promethearchaeota archaeon]
MSLLSSINFILITICLFILIHILAIIFRDNRFLREFKKYKDPESISINDLKYIPLVNIIVPAWNEGDLFKECLNSIAKLTYPKLKIIVNAGGSKKTLDIANSFKEDDRFLILHQKIGKGKIQALNDCLPYISEGILYMVDADVILIDETLLRMIYPIVNLGEHVVIGGIRPLPDQEKKDLVKYLTINRNLIFHYKFKRYWDKNISGANTCISYEAMRSVGKFSVDTNWAEDMSRGYDLLSKGYKIYYLTHYRGKIFSYTPDTLKKWINQRIRWNENDIIFAFENRNFRKIIRIITYSFISIYFIISPILTLIHFFFILLTFYMLLNKYFLKIRRLIFYKRMIKGEHHEKFGILFFIKIILYIFIEITVYFYTFLEMLMFGGKKLKKRKNID